MTTRPASTHRGLRLLALCAVAAGLLLLAAATFLLSYAGVHEVALAAGVSPRLARLYPLILDGMVVVAGAAVLSLRGAGLPSRWYAWLSLLVMLAADAAADTVHAVGTKLPHKQTAAAAAIIPWALVLIGFSLLLTMLRHARLRGEVRREASARGPVAEAGPGAAAEREHQRANLDADAELDERAQPDADDELDWRPEPDADTEPDERADLDADTELDERTDLDADDELKAEADPDAEGLFQSEDDIEPAALPGAEPKPGVGPQLERVHSTPVRPET